MEWNDKYNADTSIESEEFDDGRLETYGADMQKVLEIYEKSPRKVWTAVDGDDGVYLVNGLHYVNRIFYLISLEDGEEDEEFLEVEYGQDDDEL